VTIEDQIAAAEAALAKLVTGSAFVEVEASNGARVKFSAASVPDLLAYISALKSQAAGTPPVRTVYVRSKGWSQ
jgi:hypothetical protein